MMETTAPPTSLARHEELSQHGELRACAARVLDDTSKSFIYLYLSNLDEFLFRDWWVNAILVLQHSLLSPEHMEEDEDAPNSIPPWVELEYSVNLVSHRRMRSDFFYQKSFLAYAHPCRIGISSAFHQPLRRVCEIPVDHFPKFQR